jgi:beta-lysine 5,6-aminomutase beta subunit
MQKKKKDGFIKPYGDSIGDGAVQLSFVLPGVSPEGARRAAEMLAHKMGIIDPFVSECTDIGSDMVFIILYGRVTHRIDLGEIPLEEKAVERVPDMKTIDRLIAEQVGREVVVIGACIESDAHTVGIDAIMNMKGYAGDYGLERYKNIAAINLGAQVSSEEVVRAVLRNEADAVLISQIVTQKNVHVKNLTRLVDLLEAERVRDKVILIVGGPRITAELATELGFDAGFGRETLPSHVAYFILKRLVEREGKK